MLQGYFKDRTDAGEKLAGLLENYKGKSAVVYALPRGGVVIGKELAKALKLPLDLIITRKIGHPSQPEYAIGAVAENGHGVFNEEEVLNIGGGGDYLADEVAKQQQEARRRREVYLSKKKPIPCKGKVAILVDDGIATGLTVKAAIKELKLHYKPARIVVAVPVAARDKINELEAEGIEVMAVITSKDFLGAIGAYYKDFLPVEDDEVIRIMKEKYV